MDKPAMKSLRYLIALVLLMPVVGSMASPAGAAKEDCRFGNAPPTSSPFHCLWDQEEFQGQMQAVDSSGQCANYAIRSAANNGKSGYGTLYIYEAANCAGDAVRHLNAGESVGAVVAKSARFGPKGLYR
jgi:hypothetical protein